MPQRYHDVIGIKLGLNLNSIKQEDLVKPMITYLGNFAYDVSHNIENLTDQANYFYHKWGRTGR